MYFLVTFVIFMFPFRDGKSRQFGFIGFRTEDEAEEAIKYFNRSYLDTCRITCEVGIAVSISCSDYFFCIIAVIFSTGIDNRVTNINLYCCECLNLFWKLQNDNNIIMYSWPCNFHLSMLLIFFFLNEWYINNVHRKFCVEKDNMVM